MTFAISIETKSDAISNVLFAPCYFEYCSRYLKVYDINTAIIKI